MSNLATVLVLDNQKGMLITREHSGAKHIDLGLETGFRSRRPPSPRTGARQKWSEAHQKGRGEPDTGGDLGPGSYSWMTPKPRVLGRDVSSPVDAIDASWPRLQSLISLHVMGAFWERRWAPDRDRAPRISSVLGNLDDAPRWRCLAQR